ncbi:hypothetical protein C8J55DRAFT_491827 [Lentinula edodes]|uniref:Uncharacterized protein n=1 Tax=Lentinula lateritia TaxID=40482 RepID=A0A9W8ZZH8_9AGAR|nr:hypothetical protein C8J55DRAFT_491827 [Lentinula edodes]
MQQDSTSPPFCVKDNSGLEARVIFYASVELAKSGGYGIVQEDVFLLGTTPSVSISLWEQTRSIVNVAATGNVNTVAGLQPIEGMQELENVDVTDKVRSQAMPVILEEVGFKVTEREFDEVEVRVDFVAFFLRNQTSKASASSSLPMNHHHYDNASTNLSPNPDPDSLHLSWFARRKAKAAAQKTAEQRRSVAGVQRPPSYARVGRGKEKANMSLDEELPPRKGTATPPMRTASHEIVHRGDSTTTTTATATTAAAAAADSSSHSATPTCTPNSNTTSSTSSPSSSSSSSPSTTTTTITFSKLTPHHTTSTIPKPPGSISLPIKAVLAGLAGLESKVGKIRATTAEVVDDGGWYGSTRSIRWITKNQNKKNIDPYCCHCHCHLPPTPSSKSPNVAYISFHRDESGGGTPTTSTSASVPSYNYNDYNYNYNNNKPTRYPYPITLSLLLLLQVVLMAPVVRWWWYRIVDDDGSIVWECGCFWVT